MPRSVAGTRGWTQHGTALFMSQTDLGDRALGEPSALPGWSRRHVLALADAMTGPLAEIAAYLTGRVHHLTTAEGRVAPVLRPGSERNDHD